MRFIRNEILRTMDTFPTWGIEHGCHLHMGKQILTIRPCDEALAKSLGQKKATPPAYLQFYYQGKAVAQYREGSPTVAETFGKELIEDKAKRIMTAKKTVAAILAALPSWHKYIDFMEDLSMREQFEGRMVQPDPEGILRFLLPQHLDDGLAMVLVIDQNSFHLQLEVYLANK